MPTARQAAKEAGEKFYEGTACRRCGRTVRYVRGCECVRCARQQCKDRMRSWVKARRELSSDGVKYSTGTTCERCGTDSWWVCNGKCVACESESSKKRRLENLDEARAKGRASTARYQSKYPDRVRAANRMRSRIFRTNYPEKSRENLRRYCVNNPERVRYNHCKNQRARYCRKLQCSPGWMNAGQLAEIQSIYELSGLLGLCGVKHHVDHIAPIQGREATGLHVPWNLRVVTWRENVSKSNSVDESLMIDHSLCRPVVFRDGYAYLMGA